MLRDRIQLAANALAEGGAAVWVGWSSPFSYHIRVPQILRRLTDICSDCSFAVSGRRAAAVAHALRPGPKAGSESLSETPGDHLAHYHCPSIPHLIALLCRPTANTLPSKTAVIVIDSLSALINCAFPRTADKKSVPANGKGSSERACVESNTSGLLTR